MGKLKQYQNFIDGKWVAPSKGQYYQNINPANRDDIIAEYALSTKEDVDAAIESCHRAFSIWGKMLVAEREKYIEKFICLIDANKQHIAEMLTREEGKTLKEALGEPTRGVIECKYNLGEGQRMEGITMPSDRPGVVSVANRVPLGVVAAISPWNFPFLTPLRKIIPALVAGNTVVFKPAMETPHCGVMIMELIEQAGFPAGVVNMVTGRGSEIGDFITQNPLVRGITFTGSTAVGRLINQNAAPNFTKVQLEMGGKNPSIIAQYHDLESAATQLASASFALAGQRCTSISRIIVLEDQADEMERLLEEKTKKNFVVGDGMDPKVNIGPIINEKAGNDIMAYIQSAIDQGATVRCGGNRLTGGIYDKGFYIEPTLITNVTADMKVATEEIFGPVLVVIRVKDFDEAIRVANDTQYGLAASLFSDNMKYIYRFMQEVEAGMLHVNHGTVTDGTMPFGGVKNSGIGQFSKGKTNKDFFTQYKVIYTKYQ